MIVFILSFSCALIDNGKEISDELNERMIFIPFFCLMDPNE